MRPDKAKLFYKKCSTPPRAAIYYNGIDKIVMLDNLSTPDCVVALMGSGIGKMLIVSAYLDINKPVVEEWLRRIIKFSDDKNWPIIIGMDSNAHSTLFGKDNNSRGEELEDFIINNGLCVENVGTLPTYEAQRGYVSIATCIDVTLSRGLPLNAVSGWHIGCLLYTSPSPRDKRQSRMPSSA